MKTPLVSILIPVYKTPKKSLLRCFNSIRCQTCADWEAIVVDDGSPDECGSICEQTAEEDARIRVIHQNNLGVSGARNTALRHARGKYLLFVDADDELLTDALRTLSLAAEKDLLECVIFGWEEDTEYGIRKRQVTGEYKSLISKNVRLRIARSNTDLGGGYPWTKFWKTDALRDAEGALPLFDEEIDSYEDKLWTVCALRKANRVAAIPAVLYHYHREENSLTHCSQNKKQNAQVSLAAYRKIALSLQDDAEAYSAAVSFWNALAVQELFAAARLRHMEPEHYEAIRCYCDRYRKEIKLSNIKSKKQKMQWILLALERVCPEPIDFCFQKAHQIASGHQKR